VDIKLYRDKLKNLEFNNKALLAIVLSLAIALVTNGFFARQVIVHVAPVELTRPYEMTERSASQEYLRQMALSLMPLVANVTPTSVDVSHEAFRRYLTPRAFGGVSEALAADAQYIKQYQVARVFWPEQVDVDQQGNRVTLIGREHRMIGRVKVAEEERVYVLSFDVRDWRAQVADFAVLDAVEYRKSVMAAHGQ
jgi:type IV conjugative transfer system protein TraE